MTREEYLLGILTDILDEYRYVSEPKRTGMENDFQIEDYGWASAIITIKKTIENKLLKMKEIFDDDQINS